MYILVNGKGRMYALRSVRKAPVSRILSPPVMTLLTLMLMLPLLIHPATADLPRTYQSDDVDRSGSMTNTSDPAEYYDFVFPYIPSVVEEQNRRFIQSFPQTDEWASAVPSGVSTRSSGVIKDAYIKLIPVKGLVKVDSGFAANKSVTVGYLLDYRVQLPPDKTGSYPKHYYYLESHSAEVTITGKNTKRGGGERDVVDIEVEGRDSVRATATIKVVVKEKIIEKHTHCERDCDSNGQCTVSCHTYYITKYRHHTYTLTVEDSLRIVNSKPVQIYTLLREKPVKQCIFLNDGVASLAWAPSSGSGSSGGSTPPPSSTLTPAVKGLRYYTTYRVITDAYIHKTAGKSGYAGSDHVSLDEPAYFIASIPSFSILPISAWIEKEEVRNATVSVPNFKSEIKPFDVVMMCVRAGGSGGVSGSTSLGNLSPGNLSLIPLDIFGNPVKTIQHVKKLVKPSVNVTVEAKPGHKPGEKEYTVKMFITYNNNTSTYTGPVYISFRAKTFTINATDGYLEFTVNESGTVNYFIPSTIPDDWYNASEDVFMDSLHGSFYVGKIQPFMLPIYEFVIVAAAVAPLAILYYVLKRLLVVEEEEYI